MGEDESAREGKIESFQEFRGLERTGNDDRPATEILRLARERDRDEIEEVVEQLE